MVEFIPDADGEPRAIPCADGVDRYLVWIKPAGLHGWHDILTLDEIADLVADA